VFAYATPVTEDDKKSDSKVVKAVLSTTAKAKAAKAKAEKAKAEAQGAQEMDVDTKDGEAKADKMDVETTAVKEEDEDATAEDENAAVKEETKPEPTSEELTNPSRVTLAQEKLVRFDPTSRFLPIAVPTGSSKFPARGLIVLRDAAPDEETVYVEPKFKPAAPPAAPDAADGDEPAPPEDFEFDPADEDRGF
jgi:26S proteasome regulatory subunit N2